MASRRALLLLCACWVACVSTIAGASDTAAQRREDFDAMWRAIDTHYAYFEGRRAQWRRAREAWRAEAGAADSRDDFIAALEGALATLRDDHVTLSERTARSPRRVPADTDLWARWKDGVATIESVRFAGDADVAGVRPGDQVTRIDGVPADRAVARYLERVPRPTPADRDWALRHALAGPRSGTLALDLGGKEPRHANIERDGRAAAAAPSLATRRVGDQRDIGYLRLRNLADPGLAEQLDAAMGYLDGTRALIVDLREAAPGSREATQAVLARFATRAGPWQQRVGRDGKRVVDRVARRASAPFKGPIVALVDRWTFGETEALAAGLVAVASARLVGTPMAGLRGELHEVRLRHSGLVVRFPGEKAFLPDGTPREALRPAVEIDPAAPSGGPGDPILYQALKLLEK